MQSQREHHEDTVKVLQFDYEMPPTGSVLSTGGGGILRGGA
jgi:hypothetical protein